MGQPGLTRIEGRPVSRRLALVTGSTGFLGGHVVRALVQEGWGVRALARGDPGRSLLLEGLPIEAVPGDLNRELPEGIARGVSAVVHLAGILKARTLEEYREVNARGTLRLIEAARREAPEALFVHVSSQAAAGPAREGRPVAEGDPPRPVSWYGITKREGEDAVRQEWPGPWIVLRPGVVYGPGDRGLLTYFRMAARGWMPVPAGRSWIQIDAASRISLAIARAASRTDLAGRTGFVCSPGPIRVADLAAEIARLPPRPPRRFPVPDALVRLAGSLETLREGLTGRSRPFNADKAREILAGDWLCDPSLGEDLALPPPAPLPEGLSLTWDWYLREGWLAL